MKSRVLIPLFSLLFLLLAAQMGAAAPGCFLTVTVQSSGTVTTNPTDAFYSYGEPPHAHRHPQYGLVFWRLVRGGHHHHHPGECDHDR